MELITLNIWGGRVYGPLFDFLKKQSRGTEIFCFQEVFNNPPKVTSIIQPNAKQNIYTDLKKVLSEFSSNLSVTQENEQSLSMSIRKGFEVKNTGDVFVYRWKNALENADPSTLGVILQHTDVKIDAKTYTICNLHGHWTRNYKGDNKARIEQAKKIKEFLDKIKNPKILCGDFNVAPNTETMAILETSMRNLVKEYNVTSTRSSLHKEEVKFADYIMVSPEIEVEDFKVFQNNVSDHLPLFLKFR